MTIIQRIRNLISKFARGKKENSFASEEDFVGYEAFSSRHQDELLENGRESSRLCGKS
jgi:hypothetical protein